MSAPAFTPPNSTTPKAVHEKYVKLAAKHGDLARRDAVRKLSDCLICLVLLAKNSPGNLADGIDG
jgi:hypothetical protein